MSETIKVCQSNGEVFELLSGLDSSSIRGIVCLSCQRALDVQPWFKNTSIEYRQRKIFLVHMAKSF
jgi:hypothetical protein